ncbi:10936_t:CDS:2 [Paraglomus brasilianum]|uniref:10936_t:CDS:1 n=1 Tax=Paraglomus brasilianum TaxID=144538 RepID=A0A9N9B818_9GLOM|nr:10936_t:CDS:2 [Paraglomus brasilianum]
MSQIINVESEPRLISTACFNYVVHPSIQGVYVYFMKKSAFYWCMQNYIIYIIETETLNYDQAVALFVESLKLLNRILSIPSQVKLSALDTFHDWNRSVGLYNTVEYVLRQRRMPSKRHRFYHIPKLHLNLELNAFDGNASQATIGVRRSSDFVL